MMILGKEPHEWHMIAKIQQINEVERIGSLIELMAWWDSFCFSQPEHMAKYFYKYYIYDGNFDTSWVSKEIKRLLEVK